MAPGRAWRRAGRSAYLIWCSGVFVFLIVPLVVIVPLSFNAEPYFTFTEGMLRLDPDAYSLRWYRTVVGDQTWSQALLNSLFIGLSATALATVLGTLAALGLSSPALPGRTVISGLLISPMVHPGHHLGGGHVLLLLQPGLSYTYLGLILAHATLGTPFVVITVTATLFRFRHHLVSRRSQSGRRAAADVLARRAAADRSGCDFGRRVCLCHLVRRGGDGVVHGRPGTAHGAASDVDRYPRADQSGDSGCGQPADRLLAAVPADRRVAASPHGRAPPQSRYTTPRTASTTFLTLGITSSSRFLA